MVNSPDNENTKQTLRSVNTELSVMLEGETKEAAFRSNAKWVAEGEKNTKYFLNLEKQNCCNKTMTKTIDDAGVITNDAQRILEIQNRFYEKLYSKDQNVKFSLTNNSGKVLSRDEALAMSRPISESEIFDAMMTLKCKKTPGCDGLPIEFYRKFGGQLRKPLFDLYKQVIKEGKLNMSGKRGVINLIPKKASDPIFVKNWRPITLLNYDYKIFAKLIVNRLLEVTDMLIGDQQTGFLKGRHIQNNIRKTIEVVMYLRKENKPGIVAEIDFSKCFDRVDFEALRGVFN